jgi:hypothetical protein
MDADNSNKPAQTPGLNPGPGSVENGQKHQKNGGTAGPINRKTTTQVGGKRETKLPNQRKNVNLKPPGKDQSTLP